MKEVEIKEINTLKKVYEDDQKSFYNDDNGRFKVIADQGEMEIVTGKIDLDKENEFEDTFLSISAFIDKLEQGLPQTIKYSDGIKKIEKKAIMTSLTTGYAGIWGYGQ